MVVEHLQHLPLLAQVHPEDKSTRLTSDKAKLKILLPDVSAGNRQIVSALVEAEILDFIVVVQLDGLEVLQLTQIPQFDTRVLCGSGQVVTVFREGHRSDGASVAREVCHVRLLFDVPDLNLRCGGTGAKNQTIRVELSCRETSAIGTFISNLTIRKS